MGLCYTPAPMRWLTHPAEYRRLLTLAWPIIVSRAAQVVIGFSDAAMAGRLGEDQLAATSTGAMNAFTLFILPMGVVFIVSSFSSQLTGEGKPGAARAYGWYGLAVAAATAVASVASIPLVPHVLGLLSLSPSVTALMTAYLQVRLLSGVAVIGTEALGAYYGGLGNTRLPMLAGILSMVLNVFLNWVLIFGNLGAPALGVVGAAWASNLASTAGLAVLLVCFLMGVGGGARRLDGPLKVAGLWRMLRFGVPSGLNWFLEFGAFMFFINVVVAHLGTTALAGMMAVIQLSSMAFMPSFGLSTAGSILVGQSLGAGDLDEVPHHVGRTTAVAIAWQLLVGATFLTLPVTMLAMFVPPDQRNSALVTMGVDMLRVSVAWQVFDATTAVLTEALRAAGDTSFTLYARVVVAWGVVVPGSWITVRVLHMGHVAATLWLVLYLFMLASVLLWRFRRGNWRTIGLTGATPEPLPV